MDTYRGRRTVGLLGSGVMLVVGVAGLLFLVQDVERWNWFYTGVALVGIAGFVDHKRYWLKVVLMWLGTVIIIAGIWLRSS